MLILGQALFDHPRIERVGRAAGLRRRRSLDQPDLIAGPGTVEEEILRRACARVDRIAVRIRRETERQRVVARLDRVREDEVRRQVVVRHVRRDELRADGLSVRHDADLERIVGVQGLRRMHRIGEIRRLHRVVVEVRRLHERSKVLGCRRRAGCIPVPRQQAHAELHRLACGVRYARRTVGNELPHVTARGRAAERNPRKGQHGPHEIPQLHLFSPRHFEILSLTILSWRVRTSSYFLLSAVTFL